MDCTHVSLLVLTLHYSYEKHHHLVHRGPECTFFVTSYESIIISKKCFKNENEQNKEFISQSKSIILVKLLFHLCTRL